MRSPNLEQTGINEYVSYDKPALLRDLPASGIINHQAVKVRNKKQKKLQ